VVELDRDPDDSFLLCSDGLTDMLSEEELTRLCRDHDPLGELADRLIEAANAAGGNDNISVLLLS
jgi:serine/threonine protein phosphatase PrpC